MAEFDLNPLVEGISGTFGHVVFRHKNGKTFAGKKPHMTDPKSDDQLAIRDIFSKLSHFGQLINTSVLVPYMRPKPKNMTHYNKFIKNNTHIFEAKQFNYQDVKIFNGPLFNPGIYKAEIIDAGDPTIESISFIWDSLAGGEGEDVAIAIIYDESKLSGVVQTCHRKDANLPVRLGILAPIDITKAHAYLLFYQPPIKGKSKTGLVSGTAYSEITFVRKEGQNESSTTENKQEEQDESQAPTSSKSNR